MSTSCFVQLTTLFLISELVALKWEDIIGVLLLSQAQEYPASANLARLVQRLPALQVGQTAAPL
jgi:hypothetical protein